MDKIVISKKVWNGRVLSPTYPPNKPSIKIKERLKEDTFCTSIRGLR